ncbi:MAG: arginine--tRNA ligase [Dysgonamonadaceae bacterium]|nr:arginine--tRNA ligase [Dysgonamonadaceae bacterium]
MNIEQKLQKAIIEVIAQLYNAEVNESQITLQRTKKEFTGHYTLVTFPLLRISKKSPEATAQEIGEALIRDSSNIVSFNVIKGFLNLSLSSALWLNLLEKINSDPTYGFTEATEDAPLYMVEYSSPNTNKPLHLGHVRNNLLGHSLCEILKANGKRVVKTNIVNDRGIHICKSMLAWQKWGNNETPESSGKKGDHLIGEYYVLFDQKQKAELSELEANGLSKDEAEAQSTLMAEAREMLLKWEDNDTETVTLWKMMNDWVYKGFYETYKELGVTFDKIYYESDTYLVGREEVLKGLEKGLFYRKEDNSVWANLESENLDHKLLLRADGTSVYMTQDIGTAKLRYDDYPIDTMIYVVGNEQNHHFIVLSAILDMLGYEFGKGLVHFSYGMVELPEGKMKSREGTVVDADDLIAEMIDTARKTSNELGKLDNCTPQEADDIVRMVGLGALKYFILKVDPKKNMTFNPEESIDFNGHTGPFIQYTHARIQSVLRKAAEQNIEIPTTIGYVELSDKEEGLVQTLVDFSTVIKQAAEEYNVSLIANYVYDLVKEYNQFYHDFSILREENESLKAFRLMLSQNVALTIKKGMSLLGIDVPDRM